MEHIYLAILLMGGLFAIVFGQYFWVLAGVAVVLTIVYLLGE